MKDHKGATFQQAAAFMEESAATERLAKLLSVSMLLERLVRSDESA